MKLLLSFAAAGAITGVTWFSNPDVNTNVSSPKISKTNFPVSNKSFKPLTVGYSVTSVSDVVTKALAFKALLTTTQQSTLQQTYTTTLARKWSNLPCGSGCRNGMKFGDLTATQLTAALGVIEAAAGTTANEGYDEFLQIRAAEEVLQATAGGTNYDEGNYWISFLNTPSTTGAWMLQYGGHHYAVNIALNGGNVVGTTPIMEGVEPVSWTTSGTTYNPLSTEHDALANMLASFTSTQLTTAKLSSTFSDVLMSPGEANGNSNTMPSTKVGIAGSALTSTQQNLLIAAMQAWLQDADASSAATLLSVYTNDMSNTYIAWTGSGTSGNASTFLNANTNYVRIDGPSVWIEFVCQSGVVMSGIHYHSVWRDHIRDYGADLTLTALPLKLLDFDVSAQDDKRVITWNTADETNVGRYVIQRSGDGANNFTDIQTVAAKNNSSDSYTATDAEILNTGTIYYRLKMIDKDGSFTYSKIAAVKITGSASVSIFPNPANSTVQMQFGSALSNATMLVIATDGKTVFTKSSISGLQVTIDVSRLPKGNYVVVVNDKSGIYRNRFVK